MDSTQRAHLLFLGAVLCTALAYGFVARPRPVVRAVEAVQRLIAGERRPARPRRALASLAAPERRSGPPIGMEPGELVDRAAAMLVGHGSREQAESLLRNVLSLAADGPTRSAARQWLGYAKLDYRDDDHGVQDLKEAVLIDRHNHAARFNLGRAHLYRGELREAAFHFDRVRAELPDLWLAAAFQGQTYAKLGQEEKAEKAFRDAVVLAPARWSPRLYLGIYLESRRKPAAVRAALEGVVDTDARYESEGPAPFGYLYHVSPRDEFSSMLRQLRESAGRG